MDNFSNSTVMSEIREGPIFQPQDLSRMRHAYEKACHAAMMPDCSEAQRTGLAKAIVATYQSGLTEEELLLAATRLLK